MFPGTADLHPLSFLIYISDMVVCGIFSLAVVDGIISKDSWTPLLVVIPGLTSDSDAAVSL